MPNLALSWCVLDDVDALKAFLHNFGAIWTMLVAWIPAK